MRAGINKIYKKKHSRPEFYLKTARGQGSHWFNESPVLFLFFVPYVVYLDFGFKYTIKTSFVSFMFNPLREVIFSDL